MRGIPLEAEQVLKYSDEIYCLKLVDCDRKASSTAQFSLMYLYPLPDDGRMKDRNMS